MAKKMHFITANRFLDFGRSDKALYYGTGAVDFFVNKASMLHLPGP